MHMGTMIFGFDSVVLLMIISGLFYLVGAALIWKPFRTAKNELINALFAFLVYQSISMIFMGIEMHTMNMFYGNVAALSIIIGSAYMLKFPFSKMSEKSRNVIFMSILIVALGAFAWFMLTPERQHMLMNAVLWYDIVTNGIIVGGSIVLFGFNTVEKMKRKKALAGGAGVMSCCVVSNVAMISGAFFVSAIFQFLAPLLIIRSVKSYDLDKTPGSNDSTPNPTISSDPQIQNNQFSA